MTAVELLPVHHIADEHHLVEKGLTNYWGYSSIGYLAPHALYAATGRHGEQVREFKGMVKALHRAGIEVILDVVYNHTAEGNHLGPMLAFKGRRQRVLLPADAGRAALLHGLHRHRQLAEPDAPERAPADHGLAPLLRDRLPRRRLPLRPRGSALAREFYDVDRLSAFFDTIHQDPVLSQVKLIAEPWDVGPGGYQVGNFPILWAEWNGLYRDCVRDFWRGESGLAEFAQRFTGSSDLYQSDGRKPGASINFVTAHDGFTLNDLVSYNEKHNEANLEDNRDGTDDNRSWNCGVEGPTDEPEVNALRERQMRNFLTTLFLSQGVPMLLGGDEFARTQRGNNNAYCQDNEISWFDWELDERQAAAASVHAAAAPLPGRPPCIPADAVPDGRLAARLGPAGQLVVPGGRPQDDAPRLGRRRAPVDRAVPERRRDPDAHPPGRPGHRRVVLLLFNSHHEPVTFLLPPRRFGQRWKLELSTAEPDIAEGELNFPARAEVRSRRGRSSCCAAAGRRRGETVRQPRAGAARRTGR